MSKTLRYKSEHYLYFLYIADNNFHCKTFLTMPYDYIHAKHSTSAVVYVEQLTEYQYHPYSFITHSLTPLHFIPSLTKKIKMIAVGKKELPVIMRPMIGTLSVHTSDNYCNQKNWIFYLFRVRLFFFMLYICLSGRVSSAHSTSVLIFSSTYSSSKS